MDIQTKSGIHVLTPEGEVTIFEAEEFRNALLTLAQCDGLQELDLSHVERMDTSGVQLVVAARQTGTIQVTGLSPDLRQSLQRVGCDWEEEEGVRREKREEESEE